MAGRSKPNPSIHHQPLSVDFIDNQMQEYHDAFKNPQSRYNPALGRYVEMTPGPSTKPPRQEHSGGPRPRTLQPAVEAMHFWTLIFSDSMQRFTMKYATEPTYLIKKGVNYEIRAKRNWEDIYSQLQKAREAYDGTRGFWGRMKRGSRTVADHSATTKQVVKLVPENEYVSPVLAVVEVLVDAIQKGAQVREEVTGKFDGKTLEAAFGNIEVFFSIFPKDEPIKEASIELVVSILKAVEDAIGFFISKQIARAASVILRGDDYQKELLGSLGEIDENSRALIAEAEKSHMNSTNQSLSAIFARTSDISYKLDSANGSVEYIIEKVDFIFDMGNKLLEKQDLVLQNQDRDKDEHAKHDAFTRTCFQRLLSDSEKQAAQLRQVQENGEQQKAMLKKQEDEIHNLRDVIERQRTPTPFQPHPQSPWPPPHSQQPQSHYYGSYLPPIWQPATHQPYSPWITPQLPPQTGSYIDATSFQELLGINDLDLIDMKSILESQTLIPFELRSRSEQLITTSQFRSWLVVPKSRRLLVHGDFIKGPNYVSPISLLCATFTQVLRKRDRYISLVFFCGSHLEADEGPVGGRAMIRSLIAQLLRQHSFDFSRLGQEINLEHIQRGSMKALCSLFSWLVKRVPNDITLIVLLDGISHYEIDEDGFEDEMLRVIRLLLGFATGGDGAVPTFRFLVTSPGATDGVFDEFEKLNDGAEDEDEYFVDMAELPVALPQFGMLSLESELDPQDSKGP